MLVANKDIAKIQDRRVVLLQSGGLESCFLACFFNRFEFEVHHMFVDYGQNASESELKAVKRIVETYGGELHTVKIDMPWLHDATVLNGHEVEEYDVERKMGAVEAGTYVPMRNHLLISMASSLAESLNIKYIASGLDGAYDFFGRPTGATPDKHPNFVKKLEASLTEGSTYKHMKNDKFTLITPLLGHTKEQTIIDGRFLGCDFSLSWSCYNGGEEPCGKCCACIDRKNHFENLNLEDKFRKFE